MRIALIYLSFFKLLLADGECPESYTYQLDLNLCLKAIPSTTWASALTLCHSGGGEFSSIHDGFTNALLAQTQQTLTAASEGWLGAWSDDGRTWQWSDGKKFDYTKWQTSNTAGRCASMDSKSQMWNSINCSQHLPSICATASFVTTTPSTTPTTSPPKCQQPDDQPLYNCLEGWQYFPTTGSQYLVAFDMNFTAGEAYCVSQGGNLASIHTDAENQFVMNLCCQSGCDFSNKAGVRALYLLGAFQLNGKFAWTDGSTFYYQKFCWWNDACYSDAYSYDTIFIPLAHCGYPATQYCQYLSYWCGASDKSKSIFPYVICKK